MVILIIHLVYFYIRDMLQVSPETLKIAQDLIKQAEDCELAVYKDTAIEQNLTIGWGHKLKPGQKYVKITQQQADQMLKNDIKMAVKNAIEVVGKEQFTKLSPIRQAILIDMAFNMGKFNFPKTIQSIKSNKFDQAAYQMLESKYRIDTKSRCLRNCYMMRDDKIYTKQQSIDKALFDKILQVDVKGNIVYPKQIKNQQIKNIYKNTNQIKSDADLAKQIDRIKQNLNTNANIIMNGNDMIGGVSFNIDPISTKLNGFISDPNYSIKMIEGQLYDQSNYTFMDLVTPLKIMYDPQIKSKNISVSLDPLIPTQPDGPWYAKTFYPKQLKDTQYGAAMIQADYLMKRLSLGVDEDNKPYPYPKRLKEMGLDINDIFNTVQIKNLDGNRTRLWIVIKDYQVALNDRYVQIRNIKMGVQLKALELTQSGSLRDCQLQPSPIAKRFCQVFTNYYDQLCQYYPILNKMKRLAKASIIAKFMYFRHVQVDINLINKLHEKQKHNYQQTIPRLQNTLKKQMSDRIIQMQVLGGCSFDIHNMQTKINQVENQIRELRKLYQAKKSQNSNVNEHKGKKDPNINTNINVNVKQIQANHNNKKYQKIYINNIPLKINQLDNSQGKFIYVIDEKNQINDCNTYPFLFQSLVQCRICKKICNSDYYSITNKQCIEHSTMKCKLCHRLVVPGQAYKSNADKSMIFHDLCLACQKCSQKIDGPFANVDNKLYHPQCRPKKQVGKCGECSQLIYEGQPFAQNPQAGTKYHGQCAKIVNKRMQDAIPSCKYCNVKLSGQFVRYQNQPYHQACAKKMLGIN